MRCGLFSAIPHPELKRVNLVKNVGIMNVSSVHNMNKQLKFALSSQDDKPSIHDFYSARLGNGETEGRVSPTLKPLMILTHGPD